MHLRSRETEKKTRRGALVYTDIHSKYFLKNVLTWGFKLPCLFLAFKPRINAQDAPENNKPRQQFQFDIDLYVA